MQPDLYFPDPLLYLLIVRDAVPSLRDRRTVRLMQLWSSMTDGPSFDPAGKGGAGTGNPADDTLGGYLVHHSRAPAFEGLDGHPYTVSLEVEKTPDLTAPFSGYLVFPRWADTGIGIVGHLETPLLLHGTSREDVEAGLANLTLLEVQDLLHEAIRDRHEENRPC